MKVPPIALFGIFGLGALWGYIHSGDETTCVLPQVAEGVVCEVRRRTPSTNQYIVQTKSDCTLLVTTTRFPEYVLGDELRISGNIEPLSDLSSDLAGYASYLDQQNIDGTVRFGDVAFVQEGERSWRVVTSDFIRRAIEQVLPMPAASVAVAMVLGDRGMVPENIIEAFQKTGTSHIIAISGLHLSLLVGVFLGLTSFLPINSRTKSLVVMGLMWMYVILVNAPVSAMRAAFFWSISLLAFQLRALVSLTTIIVLAVWLFVTVNPKVVLSVSFQLSFAAVIGIGLALFLFRNRKGASLPLQDVLLVSIGAAATTWPIVSIYFGIISPISIFTNVLAVPAVPLFLLGSLVSATFYSVLPVAGIAGGALVNVAWQWIAYVVRFADNIPAASFEYVLPLWAAVVWYVMLAIGSSFLLMKQRRSWREVWA